MAGMTNEECDEARITTASQWGNLFLPGIETQEQISHYANRGVNKRKKFKCVTICPKKA